MAKIKPGYPRYVSDDTGVRNVYVYFDLTTTLTSFAQSYAVNKKFTDNMPVARVSMERVDLTLYSELTIETFLPKGQTSIPTGGVLPPPAINPDDPLTKQTSTERTSGEVKRGAAGVDDEYPYYEIDYTQVEKPLKQHPAFVEFTAEELNQLKLWEEETDGEARAAFQYWYRTKDGAATGTVQTLSSEQQDYAKLRLLGVESFLDFAPLARKTSRFTGNTMPDVSDAGQKADSDPFDAVPGGYEWLKVGDRASKMGEGSDWMRVEEWQGARKILLDKDELFLS